MNCNPSGSLPLNYHVPTYMHQPGKLRQTWFQAPKLLLTNRNLLAASKDKALFSNSNRLKPLILSGTDSPNHETYSKLTKSSQFWNCDHLCCEISNPIVVKVSLKDRMKNTTVVSTEEIDVKFQIWDDLDLPKSTLFKDRTDRVSLITTAGKAPSPSHAFCY